MSILSQAWHDTPPAIRDFYHNYHRRHLAHCWKAEHLDSPPRWIRFHYGVWSFASSPGFNMLIANLEWQLWLTGRYDLGVVFFTDDPYYPPPFVQPLGPIPWAGAYPDQFIAVPDMAWNYPRSKYKVRRSYWTGKPRHRRNI